MKYDFKVKLDVYKLFVNEEDYDEEYLNSIKDRFDYFKIRYNDNPDTKAVDLIEMLEGYSDHNQILLIGVKDNIETVLCWYFVGDDVEDEDYKIARKDFERIIKYKYC